MSDIPSLEPLDSYICNGNCPLKCWSIYKEGCTFDFGYPLYPLLKAWYSLVVLKKTIPPSCESPMVSPLLGQLTFTELLEHSIPGNSFAIQ